MGVARRLGCARTFLAATARDRRSKEVLAKTAGGPRPPAGRAHSDGRVEVEAAAGTLKPAADTCETEGSGMGGSVRKMCAVVGGASISGH